MKLFEILQNTPEDSQLITDSIVITHAKLKRYDKILCSISGGSDSDILIDLCQKFDESSKITYAFFDTGLEFQATKEHLQYLEQKYDVHIEHVKAIKSIPFCRNKLANGLKDCKDIISNGKTKRLMNCIKNILNARRH